MDALALAIVALVATLVVLNRETCQRLLFAREDARTIAAFRIACGACTLGWTLELWPLLDYLFSDEGLFSIDVARQVFASQTFSGVADGSAAGEPEGFLDLAAVVHFAGSPQQSILFFWDTPTAVRIHFGALVLASVLLTVGLGTRVVKWITLLLFHSLITRNSVFWAGEQVFSNFLLILCFSRCGAAFSVDEALRRRRKHRAVAMIPAWPRLLALLQTIPMFAANGLAKTGEAWAAGDTFHYLLLHPHFHRFDTEPLAVLFSENVFRLMTWTAHAFELLFPLAFVGFVLRHRRALGIAALPKRRALWSRLAWIGLALATASAALLAFEGRERTTLPCAVLVAVSIGVAILALAGPVLRPVAIGQYRLDLDWVCRWPLGRRVWVTLIATFTGFLLVLTTIGWFVALTMATAILFFDGNEIGALLSRTHERGDARDSAVPATALSGAALGLGLAALIALALVVAAVGSAPMWSMGLGAVGVALALAARRSGAEGSGRRFAVGWFCALHVAAVSLVLLPRSDPPSEARAAIEAPLRRWLDHVHSMQRWRMFAPGGPRTAVDLETDVALADGTSTAIGSGLPSIDDGPLRLGRDKAEKIERRIAGREGAQWYTKWHGRYVCRRWALDHGGVPPAEVTLFAVLTPTAPPNAYARGDLSEIRAEVKAAASRHPIWQATCAHEIHGQLVPKVAARHGLAIDEAHRRWVKPRASTWADARARGDVPDLPWPLAVLGVPMFVAAWGRWPSRLRRRTP